MKRLENLVLMFSAILFAFVGVAASAGPPEVINPGGWKDDGEWVRLSTSSDHVSIGEDAASSTEYKLNVKGGAFKLTANDSSMTSGKGLLQLWNTDMGKNYLSFNSYNWVWSPTPNPWNSFKIGGGLVQPSNNDPDEPYVTETNIFEIKSSNSNIGDTTYLRAVERRLGSGPGILWEGNYLHYIKAKVRLILGDNRIVNFQDAPWLQLNTNGKDTDTPLFVMKTTLVPSINDWYTPPNAIFYTDGYGYAAASEAEIQISHMGTFNEEGGYLKAGRYRYQGNLPYFNLSNAKHIIYEMDGASWLGSGSLINLQNNIISFYTDDGTKTKNSSNYRMKIASDGNIYFSRLVDKADNNYYTQPSQDSFFNRIYANSYNSISDIRLKSQIQPLKDSSLKKILQLNGVRFNWKDDKKDSKKENIGLIAQDVEKVFPEIVSTDKNGMKSVEYANLVAPLIEAIKEQQKEIETLRAEVEALKKKR